MEWLENRLLLAGVCDFDLGPLRVVADSTELSEANPCEKFVVDPTKPREEQTPTQAWVVSRGTFDIGYQRDPATDPSDPPPPFLVRYVGAATLDRGALRGKLGQVIADIHPTTTLFYGSWHVDIPSEPDATVAITVDRDNNICRTGNKVCLGGAEEFQVFGLIPFTVETVTLVRTEQRLDLDGSIKMPTIFGPKNCDPKKAEEKSDAGLKIDFNRVSITSTGPQVPGSVQIQIPDFCFNLSGLVRSLPQKFATALGKFQFDTENLTAGLNFDQDANKASLTLQGKLNVQEGSDPEKDPSLALDFENVTVSWVPGSHGIPSFQGKGSITAKNIAFLAKLIGLKQGTFSLDTEQGSISFSIDEANLPPNLQLSGGATFKGPTGGQYELDSVNVRVGAQQGGVPIPGTPVLLTSGGFGFANLASTNLDNPIVKGTVTATVGPRIPIGKIAKLANFGVDFGNATDVALITLDATRDGAGLQYTPGSLSGKVFLDVLNPKFFTVSAAAELNWENRFFKATGSFELLDGLVDGGLANGNANLNVGFGGPNCPTDPNDCLSVTIDATGHVRLPPKIGGIKIPFIGGTDLANGEVRLQFINDADPSNDFAEAWGTVSVPFLGEYVAGARVTFDGTVSLISSTSSHGATQAGASPSAAPRTATRSSPQSTDPYLFQFDVADSATPLMLVADWETDVGDVEIDITRPDGASFTVNQNGVFTSSGDPAPGMELLKDAIFFDSTLRVVTIDQPVVGTWQVRLVSPPDSLGTVSVDLQGATHSPQVRITELVPPSGSQQPPPDVVNGAGSIDIDYSATDPDSQASVGLYYDDDNSGFNGTLIARGLPENDGPGSFHWDTLNVPPGTYYIYAIGEDENNAKVFSEYSAQRVYIPGPDDITPELRSAITSGLESAANVFRDLGGSGALAQPLPIVGRSIGEMLGTGDAFRRSVLDPVEAYFAADKTPTVHELAIELARVAVTAGDLAVLTDPDRTLGGIFDTAGGGELRFDMALDADRTLANVPLDLGADVSAIGLSLDASATLDVEATLGLDFSFGIDLSPGVSPADGFFVRVRELTAGAGVHTSDLGFTGTLGSLQFAVQGGIVDLDAEVPVQFNHETITAAELAGTPIDQLVTIHTPELTPYVLLPVSTAFTLGSLNVELAGTVSLIGSDLDFSLAAGIQGELLPHLDILAPSEITWNRATGLEVHTHARAFGVNVMLDGDIESSNDFTLMVHAAPFSLGELTVGLDGELQRAAGVLHYSLAADVAGEVVSNLIIEDRPTREITLSDNAGLKLDARATLLGIGVHLAGAFHATDSFSLTASADPFNLGPITVSLAGTVSRAVAGFDWSLMAAISGTIATGLVIEPLPSGEPSQVTLTKAGGLQIHGRARAFGVDVSLEGQVQATDDFTLMVHADSFQLGNLTVQLHGDIERAAGMLHYSLTADVAGEVVPHFVIEEQPAHEVTLSDANGLAIDARARLFGVGVHVVGALQSAGEFSVSATADPFDIGGATVQATGTIARHAGVFTWSLCGSAHWEPLPFLTIDSLLVCIDPQQIGFDGTTTIAGISGIHLVGDFRFDNGTYRIVASAPVDWTPVSGVHLTDVFFSVSNRNADGSEGDTRVTGSADLTLFGTTFDVLANVTSGCDVSLCAWIAATPTGQFDPVPGLALDHLFVVASTYPFVLDIATVTEVPNPPTPLPLNDRQISEGVNLVADTKLPDNIPAVGGSDVQIAGVIGTDLSQMSIEAKIAFDQPPTIAGLFAFDSVGLRITGEPSLTVFGQGRVLHDQIPQLGQDIPVEAALTLDIPHTTLAGSLSLLAPINHFFGVDGLNVIEGAGQFGINFGTTPLPLPTIGFAFTVQLPDYAQQKLSLPAQIAAAVNISTTAPIVAVDVLEWRPFHLLGIDQILVHHGSLVVAPNGGSIGTKTFPRGFSAAFDADILGTSVSFLGVFDQQTKGIILDATLSSFEIAGVEVTSLGPNGRCHDPTIDSSSVGAADGVQFHAALTPTEQTFTFAGRVNLPGKDDSGADAFIALCGRFNTQSLLLDGAIEHWDIVPRVIEINQATFAADVSFAGFSNSSVTFAGDLDLLGANIVFDGTASKAGVSLDGQLKTPGRFAGMSVDPFGFSLSTLPADRHLTVDFGIDLPGQGGHTAVHGEFRSPSTSPPTLVLDASIQQWLPLPVLTVAGSLHAQVQLDDRSLDLGFDVHSTILGADTHFVGSLSADPRGFALFAAGTITLAPGGVHIADLSATIDIGKTTPFSIAIGGDLPLPGTEPTDVQFEGGIGSNGFHIVAIVNHWGLVPGLTFDGRVCIDAGTQNSSLDCDRRGDLAPASASPGGFVLLIDAHANLIGSDLQLLGRMTTGAGGPDLDLKGSIHLGGSKVGLVSLDLNAELVTESSFFGGRTYRIDFDGDLALFHDVLSVHVDAGLSADSSGGWKVDVAASVGLNFPLTVDGVGIELDLTLGGHLQFGSDPADLSFGIEVSGDVCADLGSFGQPCTTLFHVGLTLQPDAGTITIPGAKPRVTYHKACGRCPSLPSGVTWDPLPLGGADTTPPAVTVTAQRIVGGSRRHPTETLQILGSDAPESVQIAHVVYHHSHPTINVDEIVVEAKNEVGQWVVLLQEPTGKVTSVNVDLGAGDDRIDLTGQFNFPLLVGGFSVSVQGQPVAVPAILRGGLGSDTISGGAGPNRIYGGTGPSAGAVGAAVATRAATHAVPRISVPPIPPIPPINLFALPFDGGDVLVGSGANDSIFGEAGNDTITGGGGSDVLDGGAGTNIINGRLVVLGTNRPERIDVSRFVQQNFCGGILPCSDTTTVTLATGNAAAVTLIKTATAGLTSIDVDSAGGDDRIDVASNITLPAVLSGGDGDDTVHGGSGMNTIGGGAGNDSLVGGAGNDSISGQAGNDLLQGGAGNDSLSGDAGDDSLLGEDGNDTLIGGDGQDACVGGPGQNQVDCERDLPLNNPPVLGSIGNQTVDEGSTLTFTATATDPDIVPTTLVGCNDSGGVVTCDLGGLPADGTATITVVVTPGAAGTLSSTAHVTANENDPNAGNNTATLQTTASSPIPPEADLSLTMADAPDPVTVGHQLTYTIGVTNNGPHDATAATLSDTLAAGLTFVSANSSVGACNFAGGTVTCSIGNLTNGAGATVSIVAVPRAAGSVSNSASVTAAESDPNTANNSASTATDVVSVFGHSVLPPAGLVSWWRAEGNADDWADGNNGTLNGVTFAPGEVGQAFSFDGSNYVEVPDSANLDFATGVPFSFEFWAFRTSTAPNQHLFGKRVGCSGTTDYNYQEPADPTQFPLNTWVHVAGTFDGTTYRAYLDGTKFFEVGGGGGSNVGPANSAPLRIGTSGTCPGFGGLIDEVQIFNRALPASEIAGIFNAGSEGESTVVVTTAADETNGEDGLISLREAINLANATPGRDAIGFNMPTQPAGAVSRYSAENNANDTVGSNNGTPQNGVTFEQGLIGQAFSLNGANQFVQVPDAPNLDFDPTSPLTVELWAFRTGTGSVMHLLGKRAGCAASSNINYQMAFAGAEGLSFGAGPPNWVETGIDLPLNTWTHLAGTFDGATYRFYINGELRASAAGTLGSPNAEPLKIGGSGDCATFAGLLDEVGIYNRALSQSEIQAIFDSRNRTGSVVQTIELGSTLPTITDPVIIDGYTQPGSSPNTLANGDNAVLRIELNGASAGASAGGVRVDSGDSVVRGLVINRFSLAGVWLVSSGNRIEGNWIGTDASGTQDLGNGNYGVLLVRSQNTVGGTVPETRNIVSGNDFFGVYTSSDGNVIQGNFIGTDASGTRDLGNSVYGVQDDGGFNNTIGGSTAGAGNVISGNDADGVRLVSAFNDRLEGNHIGTTADGTEPLGNTLNGVLIEGRGASDNTIGGAGRGTGNTIAFNGGDGVFVAAAGSGVFEAAGTGNAILQNSIFANAGLGIDLGNHGVTPNDPGDADTGPNNLQNFPVLTAAHSDASGTTIKGTLDSAASSTFRLEFFANVSCDVSRNGEGERFIGSQSATTDAGGAASFTASLPTSVPVGQFITATATDATGNTSEFSACMQVAAASGSGDPADLSATLAASPDPVTLGNNLTYTITIHNSGPDPASGVRLTFSLPAGVTFVSATPEVPPQPPSSSEQLTFSLDPGAPAGASVDPATGVFTWTPTEDQGPGTYDVTVRVTDDGVPALSDSETFTVSVNEVNRPPVLAKIRDKMVVQGGSLRFTARATDPDLPTNSLRFSLGGGFLLGAAIDPSTGVFTWQPRLAQAPGDYTMTVTVTDNGSPPLSDAETFTVTLLPDTTGPTIDTVKLTATRTAITAITLGASEPLAPASATNLTNYILVALGADNRLGTRDDSIIVIRSAVYDDVSHTVQLTPASSLGLNQFFQITVKGQSESGGPCGPGQCLTDRFRNVLDGDRDGAVGGNFVAFVGRGTRLGYFDGNGDQVSLGLSGGGVMELLRTAAGDAQHLRLVDTVFHRSILSGTVTRPRSGGDGQTTVHLITGIAGVQNKLTTPPFSLQTVSAAAVDALLVSGELPERSRLPFPLE